MESCNVAEPSNHSKRDAPSILLSVNHDDGRETLPENVLSRISRNLRTVVSETGEDRSDDASRYALSPYYKNKANTKADG